MDKDTERITIDLISRKEFNLENRGYNRTEVDDFLNDICDEMERLEAEISTLKQKNEETRQAQVVHEETQVNVAEQEARFRQVLEMAVQVKDEAIRKARQDAEAIRDKAQAEALEKLDGLGEEKERLEKEVAQLKKTAMEYRANFEKLLQAQQEALEKAENLF